jgi:predicted RNA-binding protein Jag
MKSIIEQASSIIKAIEKAWNQAEKPKEFSIKIFEEEERNFFGMSTKPAKIGIFFGNDKPATHEKSTPKPQQKIKECRSPFIASSPKNSPVRPSYTENKPSASKVAEDKTINRAPAKPTAQPTQKPFPSAKTEDRQAHHKQSAPHVKHDSQSYFAEASKGKPKTDVAEKVQQTATADIENKARRIPTTWNDTMITTAHNWLKQTLSLMGLPAVGFNSEVAGKNLKLTFNAPLIADPMQEKQLFRSFAHLIVSSLRNQYKQEIKNLKVVLIRPE